MLPDDVFRTEMKAVTADLAGWAERMRDCADVSTDAGPGYWRLVLAPHASGAAALEMILRSDQRLDITVAEETYEERHMPPLAALRPLVEAVAEGRVVERHLTSLATGALVAVETIIEPRAGVAWHDGRRVMAPLANGQGEVERTTVRDRHFLPYRRLSTI